MNNTGYYVGLMSGTSADAVDIVIVDFSTSTPILIGTHRVTISSELRQQIHYLSTPSANEIDRMGELDHQLGEFFAAGVLQLLLNYNVRADQISAIGSHGQTIRHRPPGSCQHPFTLQIGDPNVIAQRTKITTIGDFRRRDMAAGGQGAPLVPAFHRSIFQSKTNDRAIVNIGGMSNITWLPRTGTATGFDTGPGNVLMDGWIFENLGKAYDDNGSWAASGRANPELLNQFLSHPFFTQLPPKSTGREAFNSQWLKGELAGHSISAPDVQATLLALTAQSIANEIAKLADQPCEVFICGGGAYNEQLLESLRALLPYSTIQSSLELGIAPEWIEAMAFAWLAKQTLNKLSGNLTAVTGASEEVILGGVYFA